MQALRDRQPERALVLIRSGAPVPPRDGFGFSLVTHAIDLRHTPLLELVIRAGCPIDADATLAAVDSNDLTTVQTVLRHGGDPHGVAWQDGPRLLEYAAEAGHVDAVDALLTAGARPQTASESQSMVNAIGEVARFWRDRYDAARDHLGLIDRAVDLGLQPISQQVASREEFAWIGERVDAFTKVLRLLSDQASEHGAPAV